MPVFGKMSLMKTMAFINRANLKPQLDTMISPQNYQRTMALLFIGMTL